MNIKKKKKKIKVKYVAYSYYAQEVDIICFVLLVGLD